MRKGVKIASGRANIVVLRLAESGDYGVMRDHVEFTGKLVKASKISVDGKHLYDVEGECVANFSKNQLVLLES
jgi:hypothetical protein